MSVLLLLAAVWGVVLLPPWLAHRRQLRDDPLADFARFRARELGVRPPVELRVDPAKRRRQVFGVLTTFDGLAFSLALLVHARWAFALAAGLLHLTVAWYAAAVRARVRTGARSAPARPLPARTAPALGVPRPALRAA